MIIICLTLLPHILPAQIQDKSMALLTKKTATWCKYCGQWGWELENDLEERNNHKAVLLQVHPSSNCDLYNQHADEMMDQFSTGQGFPTWYLNGYNSYNYNISVAYNRSYLNARIDSVAALFPAVGFDYTFNLEDDQLVVETKVEFLRQTSGEFFLSVFIVEDGVEAYQSGLGANQKHSNVLRGAMSNSVFGEILANGIIWSGETFTHFNSITLDPHWNPGNIYLAFVVWQKVDDRFEFVNAYKDEQFIGEEQFTDSDIEVYPNPASDFLCFRNIPIGIYTSITIYNLSGEKVYRQRITNPDNEIDLSAFRSGVYIVEIVSESFKSVSRIVVK